MWTKIGEKRMTFLNKETWEAQKRLNEDLEANQIKDGIVNLYLSGMEDERRIWEAKIKEIKEMFNLVFACSYYDKEKFKKEIDKIQEKKEVENGKRRS